MCFKRLIIPIFCLLMFCLFSISLPGQESGTAPSAKGLRLKEIKFPSNLDYIYDVVDFAVVSKRTSIVLIEAEDTDGNHFYYLGKMKRNGKLEITDFVNVDVDEYADSALVWLEGSSLAPDVPQGVVFFGFETADQDHIYMYAFAFDANGKITVQPHLISDIQPPTSDEILYIYPIRASVGDHSIGVAYSYEVDNDSTNATTLHAFFVETDASGIPVSEIREVALGSDPIVFCSFQQPFWSGSMWYVPARVSELRDGKYYRSGRLLVADSVFLASPKPSAGLSLEKYFDGGTETSAYAYFLHDYAEGPQTSETTMTMLQKLTSRMPDNKKMLTKSLNEYYAREVKEDGTFLKSKKQIKVEPFESIFKVKNNMYLYSNNERPADPIPAEDGRYMLLWTSEVTRMWNGSAPATEWLSEGLIRLLALDINSGAVETIKEYKFKGEEFPSSLPKLHYRDGRYWMTIRSRDPNGTDANFYVATVKK